MIVRHLIPAGPELPPERGGRSRRVAVGLLGFCLALALAACVRSGDGPGGEAEQSVARIEAETCTGLHTLEATAVAVGPDLLVSVAHTFERVRSFDIIGSEGQMLSSELIWLDLERDLALIRTDDPLPRWLELGTASEGEVTRVISAADPNRLQVKRAVILDITSVTLDGVGERQALQLQADISSGDSGAPLVNDDGQLVGVVFATTRSADRGWAIAAEEIESVVDRSTDVPQPSCAPLP